MFIILKLSFIYWQHNSLKSKAKNTAELHCKCFIALWKNYYSEFSTWHLKWFKKNSSFTIKSMGSHIVHLTKGNEKIKECF